MGCQRLTRQWGTKVEKAFQPVAPDDGLLEVVAVASSAQVCSFIFLNQPLSPQMAACKTLPGISPTRLAQAREVKITIKGPACVPIQVLAGAYYAQYKDI